ncbi:hypothetical protein GDI3667 [Gluconacetobacter diazotrophicus PA1 5]|uniref:Uncharacterized protein n=1 Tax=Gluconacetobacter diazotrophicus (strain ATCC 49037 / DSM 5601 / CCUG 37298 / CIP 103539 / LMG 7603 / PAl5) TaxID=272568 RepID=A9H791_GLUDA|nr:hypothetical protein GDI3667 [Gluconacetobacter diazotrophicus PA1 5]
MLLRADGPIAGTQRRLLPVQVDQIFRNEPFLPRRQLRHGRGIVPRVAGMRIVPRIRHHPLPRTSVSWGTISRGPATRISLFQPQGHAGGDGVFFIPGRTNRQERDPARSGRSHGVQVNPAIQCDIENMHAVTGSIHSGHSDYFNKK